MRRTVTVVVDNGEEILICRRVSLPQEEQPRPAQGQLAEYVTIPLAAKATGLSEKAIRRKIEEGTWLDGREYRRAPDGRVYISMKGYALWIQNGR